MGTYIHRAVIAVMPPNMSGTYAERYHAKMAELSEFRASLPDDQWRALVIGPAPAVMNSFEWVIFLPDGSKEWWDTSDAGDGYRDQFLAIFPDALIAAWGDEPPTLTQAGR